MFNFEKYFENIKKIKMIKLTAVQRSDVAHGPVVIVHSVIVKMKMKVLFYFIDTYV